MEFRLLGSVQLWCGARQVALGGWQRRALLAELLLHANRTVSIDRLSVLLWGDHPPRSARRGLQVRICQLRRLLDEADDTLQTPRCDRLIFRPPGYRLQIAPSELDMHQFDRYVEQARQRQAAGDPGEAAELLAQALALWRGPALEDVAAGSGLLYEQQTRLAQRRISALEDRVEAELALGSHDRLVAELTDLVAEHPLRQRLRGQLMTALYRCARPTEALEVYQAGRRVLIDERGLEPGPGLQRLHRAILTADPRLDPPASPATDADDPRVSRPLPVPAQLPADVAGFVGRDQALRQLDRLLPDGSDNVSQPVAIAVVTGTAGVGKTALAVRWAHTVRDRFSDGQLYVNLRGYHADQPMSPAEALAGFLAALGVVGPDLPLSLDDRAARYRTEIASRRMLIVLDNAGSVEQIRPLLPGSGSNAVVVTSRDSLCGLVALNGAHRLELDRLAPGEAITLLGRLIGDRVDADPEAAATLVVQCARLPLALRVAAELAVSRLTEPLGKLVVELADRQQRLDLLNGGGDPHAAVRVVFSWSLQQLPGDVAEVFTLLGLHPGPEIDPYATAALADTNLESARRMLALLARAHLLQPTRPGRFGVHDLLRAYALELCAGVDPDPRRSALGRLLDHYRHAASLAMDAAYPYERECRPEVRSENAPTPDLADPAVALDWLDTELPNLLAVATYAAEHGWHGHILDLSSIMDRHLRTRCRYHDVETLHHQALATARAAGDQAGELVALAGLGWVHWRQGRHADAACEYQLALRLAQVVGHSHGELDALIGLGWTHWWQGRHTQGAEHIGQALRLARATGFRLGELQALIGLADIHWLQGRYAQATDRFEQALQLARAIGNRPSEVYALTGLGQVHQQRGQYAVAADSFEQSLRLARAIGHPFGEIGALHGLGGTHRLQGQYARAAAHYQQLLALAQENGDRNWQFEAWLGIGRLHHATGHPDKALTHHERALALADELGQPVDQARAHDGLAHAHHALNQYQLARSHWQHALDILTERGIDYTDDRETNSVAIRTHLADLGSPPARRASA